MPHGYGSAPSLALTGMMGAGKTTVARILGQWLGRRVATIDARVEALTGKTIGQLINEQGEAAFRAMERRAVCSLNGPLVIDLGGGAFCDPRSAAHLLSIGNVVFLDVSFAEASRRIGARPGRPLFDNWMALVQKRLPLYQRANIRVAVEGLTPEAVARRVLDEVHRLERSGA